MSNPVRGRRLTVCLKIYSFRMTYEKEDVTKVEEVEMLNFGVLFVLTATS